MRVLIVEDDRDAAADLRAALEQAGYEVGVCLDGPSSLESMRVHPPQLVLLDLMMPGMSGATVYDEMQRDPRLASIAVLIISGEPSRAPPGVPTVAKPLRTDKLLSLLAVFREVADAR
jgi:two-component system phosphate regulon response regulator PhoB